MRLQRVGHDLATEEQQQMPMSSLSLLILVTCAISCILLSSLARGLSILLIFSKNQLWVSLFLRSLLVCHLAKTFFPQLSVV